MVLIADDRSFCTTEINLERFDEPNGRQIDTANPSTSNVVSNDAFGEEEDTPSDIFAAPFNAAKPAVASLERASSVLAAISGAFLTLIDWLAKFCVFALAASFVLIWLTPQVVQLYSMANTGSSPKSELANFVLSKQAEVNVELSDIGKLETDSFDTFAATYCLEGPSLQQSREALAVGLGGIPKDVRESIVSMALHEGVTATNSWRHSNADLVNTNTAHSYMAFYSTNFQSNYDGSEKYSTCVMVTGVTFTVAEQVIAYKHIEEEYQVGFGLDCGFLSCWKVPKFATRKFKVPEFNRRTLSLKQQKELHTWMLQEAIESAGHLVAIGPGANKESQGMLSTGVQDNAWKYDPPHYAQSEL